MTDLDRLAQFYELNVMKRANIPPSTTITYSGSSGADAQGSINHNLGYNPFFIAGADIFRNGIIWSTNYLEEYSYSAAFNANMTPSFSYWCTTSALTMNLRNGLGTNQQSGIANVYGAVYVDYDSVPNPIDQLSTISEFSQDKIVQHDTVQIVNDGNTSGLTASWQVAKIVQSTVPNEYGRAGLVRARWSLDGGTNWYPMEQKRMYTYFVDGVSAFNLGEAIAVGCSDGLLYFRTANGRHGNVTTPSTYTPTSRTFTIEYFLYERE